MPLPVMQAGRAGARAALREDCEKQTCTYPVLSALCLAVNLGIYLAPGTQKAPPSHSLSLLGYSAKTKKKKGEYVGGKERIFPLQSS